MLPAAAATLGIKLARPASMSRHFCCPLSLVRQAGSRGGETSTLHHKTGVSGGGRVHSWNCPARLRARTSVCFYRRGFLLKNTVPCACVLVSRWCIDPPCSFSRPGGNRKKPAMHTHTTSFDKAVSPSEPDVKPAAKYSSIIQVSYDTIQ